MTTNRASKIKRLLAGHQPGTVELASWLAAHGIPHDLQKHYRKSGWLEPMGVGASKRPGEKVSWMGGLYSLQVQGKVSVHAGALTALSLQGNAQYVRSGHEPIYLFSPLKTTLPSWYRTHDWGHSIVHIKTAFLPPELGITDYLLNSFVIRISGAERAALECLYLTPERIGLVECYQLLENLVTLRPKVLQELLEQCRSVKVKRLFLFMAEKAGHMWQKRLDLSTIDLGKGVRSIVPGGVFMPKYALNLPEDLVNL